jgi:putative membrane protein insertion efficiency factor
MLKTIRPLSKLAPEDELQEISARRRRSELYVHEPLSTEISQRIASGVELRMRSIFKLPVYLYKYLISPILPQSCRFVPSCSEYALEAIEKHGVARGVVLTGKRLCKCHPFGKSGHDPVP